MGTQKDQKELIQFFTNLQSRKYTTQKAVAEFDRVLEIVEDRLRKTDNDDLPCFETRDIKCDVYLEARYDLLALGYARGSIYIALACEGKSEGFATRADYLSQIRVDSVNFMSLVVLLQEFLEKIKRQIDVKEKQVQQGVNELGALLSA